MNDDPVPTISIPIADARAIAKWRKGIGPSAKHLHPCALELDRLVASLPPEHPPTDLRPAVTVYLPDDVNRQEVARLIRQMYSGPGFPVVVEVHGADAPEHPPWEPTEEQITAYCKLKDYGLTSLVDWFWMDNVPVLSNLDADLPDDPADEPLFRRVAPSEPEGPPGPTPSLPEGEIQ